MNWKPIKTAPKDGTVIQLWTEADGWLPFMYWGGDGWVSKYLTWSGQEPTHWMEEPKPPGPTD